MRRWILGTFLGFLLMAALSAWWIRRELTTPFYHSPTETFIEIRRGASTGEIARLLADAGILRHRLPFLIYLRWTGEGRQLKAGDYRFAGVATPIEIARKLVRGDVFLHSITIPEGLTAHETVAHIARSGLGNLQEMKDALRRTDWIREIDAQARDLEGYLFPETYRFSRNAKAEEIVKTMVDRFRAVFSKMLLEHPLPSGWEVREVVTLASMVEKEVKVGTERGLVASVLSNRIALKIPLACDPTVIYALKLAGHYDGNIRREDLRIDSAYNTYRYEGLPPGPIANPGADSLQAALAPPKTDYLYFVSRNDGTHQFSKDFNSHAKAVAQYQKGTRR